MLSNYMLVSLSLLLTLFGAQLISELPVEPLSFEAAAFKEAFNSAVDQPRLVAILSPT
jgi:hypothetical protein